MSESSKPTLALCIPAYNAAQHLPRILGSAQKQLIPFDEILVYDDVSTDGTGKVAESFGAKVIRGEKNLGCTWGRKILAEKVKSDWIHFHDADDDMAGRFTTLAHVWMRKPDAPDVILFNYDWVDADSGKLLGQTRFSKARAEDDPILYSIEQQINPFCGLYRTKSFLRVGGPDTDPNVLYHEDVAMHCKLARAGLTFSVEEEVSIINYCVNESMSRGPAGYRGVVQSQYYTIKKSFEELQGHASFPRYNKAIGLRLWAYTRHAAWVSQWDMIRRSLHIIHACGVSIPENDSKLFQIMCRISPFGAVVAREMVGRLRRKKGQYWY
ncbi:MAG: glycosyltransferase [Verrucomicrobia bacterium]|nr:glycosyltransferase [Verrucomicrobiota bacterium]